MRNLSIPYNGDNKALYETIIPKFRDNIKEVYFPLPSAIASNARSNGNMTRMEDLMVLLDILAIDDINPALILNSSWVPLEAYTDEHISKIFEVVNSLHKRGLKKIIMKNNYYMNTGVFHKYFPDIVLEASINCMLDTTDKVVQAVEMFGYKSVVIDRSFNRNYAEFIKLTSILKHMEVGAKLLVNEGCLYACPFKQDHDNMIGMCSYGGDMFNKYKDAFLETYPDYNNVAGAVNLQYGCVSMYEKQPWLFLKSPFIRPEDLCRYDDHVDTIKISGRTQPTEWIIKVIDAYVKQEYYGDIRDLTDTGPLNGNYPNKKLGKLFQNTAYCNKLCSGCGKCETLYNSIQEV